MTSIRYRNATAADAETLSRLGRDTFVETFGHLYDPADLAAFLEGHSAEIWRGILADPDMRVRLAEDGKVAAGFVRVGPVSLPVDAQGTAMELRQFYILKPWHGAGLAPVLMDWVLEQARERQAEALYLSVFCENHRARRFYERYGFRFVKPYAFMVGNHADEDHILRLDLKERS